MEEKFNSLLKKNLFNSKITTEEFQRIRKDILEFENKRSQIVSDIKHLKAKINEMHYYQVDCLIPEQEEKLDEKYGELLKLEENIVEYENKLP